MELAEAHNMEVGMALDSTKLELGHSNLAMEILHKSLHKEVIRNLNLQIVALHMEMAAN